MSLLARRQDEKLAKGDRAPRWYPHPLDASKVSISRVLHMSMMETDMRCVNGVRAGKVWYMFGTRRINVLLKRSPIAQDEGEWIMQSFYHLPSWVVKDEVILIYQVVVFVERGNVGKKWFLQVN